ncbi:hypothetical protein DPMN_012616 [Dreissena polymorpha]|uniref:Uncharacterized protein n=1 Tax=Dreissena polymorpha TaxID=45954 RepID=A0A9D4N648_DREPO|nr:hypothetical protein DPMN_012616 [Dreissena polymorpha]
MRPTGTRITRQKFAHLRGTNILVNSHVIQLTGTIFELNSRIKETNVLSKFHKNWAKNKNAPPTSGHIFSPIQTILKLVRDINKTNVLTNFHDDWAKKTAPPTSSHVFQRIGTTFELNQDIIKTNILTNFELGRDFIGKKLLTKFYEDGTRNVASRVRTDIRRTKTGHKSSPEQPEVKRQAGLAFIAYGALYFSRTNLQQQTNQHSINVKQEGLKGPKLEINVASRVLTRKNAPPLVAMFFKATKTIFELIQDIIGTNLLTKFHEDRKINVTSNVNKKNAPPPRWPYIIGMNHFTKFHEDRTINVASRVLTRFYYSHIRKKCPSPWQTRFQANVTIFELINDINKTNLLTIFHKDWTINVASRVLTRKNAPPPGGHVFHPKGFVQDIIGMNLLTKENAPPLGSHVFQANVTIFELIQDIIETNLLTKFH